MSTCDAEFSDPHPRSCPGYYDDHRCSKDHNDSFPVAVLGPPLVQAIPAIISCTLSCLGCILIIFTYCRWKDIRTGSRAIITFLSIADFFTAFGYIVGTVNYLVFDYQFQNETHPPTECFKFTYICQIQAFITSWSSLSSFIWTSLLAIYLYISLVHSRVAQVQKFFPLFHVIAWSFPIVILLPLLATCYLGYSYYASTTWCFIRTPGDINIHSLEGGLILVAGKLWEIMTYIIVIVLYILIKRHVAIQSKSGISKKTLNPGLVAVLRRSDKKLILIPVVFVLLRCWGTIHFILSWIFGQHIRHGCTTRALSVVFTTLGFLQSVGDGGQGWGNVILYIMVSERVRKKLSNCCKSKEEPCHNRLEERSSSLNNGEDGQVKKYGTIQQGNPSSKPKVFDEKIAISSYETTTNA